VKMDRATRLRIEDRLEVMAILLRRDLLGDELGINEVREPEVKYEKKRVVPKKEVAPSLLGRLFQRLAR